MARSELAIIWSPEAENDLLDIWNYVARESSPSLADAQVKAVHHACVTLAQWPHSGRARDDLRVGVRSIVVKPYVAFYRVNEATVEVVRVLHGSRDIDAIFGDPSH